MDYKIGRYINIALGALSTGLETYAFTASNLNRNYEFIFLGVTSFYTIEAVVMLLMYTSATSWDRGWRMASCVVLVAAGGFMIWSVVDYDNNMCQSISWWYADCHEFEIKLVAAVLAIINGFVYAAIKAKVVKPVVHGYVIPAQGNLGYEGQQGQMQFPPTYITTTGAPLSQGVFVVPRVHLQPVQVVGPAEPNYPGYPPYPVQSTGQPFNHNKQEPPTTSTNWTPY